MFRSQKITEFKFSEKENLVFDIENSCLKVRKLNNLSFLGVKTQFFLKFKVDNGLIMSIYDTKHENTCLMSKNCQTWVFWEVKLCFHKN